MKLTLEEIEKFEESVDDEVWYKLYEKLDENLIKIKKAISPEIEIKLNFKNHRNLATIYTEKEEISINKKFIIAISYFLFEDSKNSNSSMFQEEFNESYFLIIEFIIGFVLLHELSHIVRNHNKIIKNDNNENIEELIEFIELDADKYGLEIQISMYFNIITKNGIEKHYYLIEKFFYSILYLHKFLIIVNDEKQHSIIKTRNKRLIYSLTTIIDIKRKNPEFIEVSIEELEKIKDQCIIKFLIINGNIFDFNENVLNEINKEVHNFFNFLRKYSKPLNENIMGSEYSDYVK